jgi:hypothetical protein
VTVGLTVSLEVSDARLCATMPPHVYCHSCRVTSSLLDDNVSDNDAPMKCGACGSEVVELVDTPGTQGLPAQQNDGQSGEGIRVVGRRYVVVSYYLCLIPVALIDFVVCSLNGGIFGPFSMMLPVSSWLSGAVPDDWMDRIASQIMDDHNPSLKPTSKKVQDNLIQVSVRAEGAQGEPGPDEAFTCAGEPCSVCHDEFSEGEKVAELPCCHVR